jgi:5-methylcytosine-specific restriction protein A
MAGARDFNKGIKGIRHSCEDIINKEKKQSPTFDKYRIYNTSKWRHLRDSILRQHPICNVCKNALATEVDHITPFSQGMTDRQKLQLGFDYTNLQAICKQCHDIKHNHIKKTDKDEV